MTREEAILKKVRLAIMAAFENYDESEFAGDSPDGFIIDGTFDLTIVARAAIAAMRTPTEAMIEAGTSQSQRGGFEPQGTWGLMIDAALKED